MGIRFLLRPTTTKNLPKPKQNARIQSQALQILSKTDVKSKISAPSPPKSFQNQNKIKHISLKPFKFFPKANENQRLQPQALQIFPKLKENQRLQPQALQNLSKA